MYMYLSILQDPKFHVKKVSVRACILESDVANFFYGPTNARQNN